MMEWIRELPLLSAVAFLYAVIWCRAGATYLVGRGARRAAHEPAGQPGPRDLAGPDR